MRIVKELIPYVIIVIVVVLIRTFIVTPVIVSGPSMEPTLKNKDILILNKLHKKFNRYDVVVIDAKINGKKERIVKRIMGLPGESIEFKNNMFYVNGKRLSDDYRGKTNDFTLEEVTGYEEIPDDYYFVMGDNRRNSLDSRDYRIGLVKKSDIIGVPMFRIWPLNKIGAIK